MTNMFYLSDERENDKNIFIGNSCSVVYLPDERENDKYSLPPAPLSL